MTEWGAVESARQLSFELGTYEGIVRQSVPSLRDHFPYPPHCHGRVRFHDDVDVLVGDDTTILMSNFSIPYHAVAQVDFGGPLPTIFQSLHSFFE